MSAYSIILYLLVDIMLEISSPNNDKMQEIPILFWCAHKI